VLDANDVDRSPGRAFVCGWLLFCSLSSAIWPGLLACDRRLCQVSQKPFCGVRADLSGLRLSGLSPSHVRHDMAYNSPTLEEQTRDSVISLDYSSSPESLPRSSTVPSSIPFLPPVARCCVLRPLSRFCTSTGMTRAGLGPKQQCRPANGSQQTLPSATLPSSSCHLPRSL
jgi:hypothetical protein